jgi:hypothetical protein
MILFWSAATGISWLLQKPNKVISGTRILGCEPISAKGVIRAFLQGGDEAQHDKNEAYKDCDNHEGRYAHASPSVGLVIPYS